MYTYWRHALTDLYLGWFKQPKCNQLLSYSLLQRLYLRKAGGGDSPRC